MLSPTTERGLLRHFPRGADPPANDPRATNPPVRSPTSLSLRAISAAGAGGWRAWGGASGRRAPREVGRGREGGEAKSKGWIGVSDNALDPATEERGWGHTLLTATPWGTQESGGERATSGCEGLQERRLESPLHDG